MKNMIPIVFLLCFFYAGSAGAIMLSLETESSILEPSSIFDVDLVVSGLDNFGAPSVGDFDIDILYDPGTMAFFDYELGPYLGDVGLFEADDWSWGDDLGGRVDLAEVSYLLPEELDALQPDSFALATLTFNYLGPGYSVISIDGSDPYWTYKVGDAFAEPLPVTLGDPLTIAPVPEPATLLLLSAGIVGIAGLRKKFIKRKIN